MILTWLMCAVDAFFVVALARSETVRLWRMRSYGTAVFLACIIIGIFIPIGLGLTSQDAKVRSTSAVGIWAIFLTNIIYAGLLRWMKSTSESA